MSTESWAAVIGIGTYFAFKAIDRGFNIIDHWLRERGLTDDDTKDKDDEP